MPDNEQVGENVGNDLRHKGIDQKIHYPVATIGMFDGVHRGHQKIIECIRHNALQKKGESVVITFDRHPKTL